MSWTERIKQARERGGFDATDKHDADAWRSCALGETEKAAGIYDLTYGDFEDTDALETWGNAFADVVERGDFDEAGRLLEAIEERVKMIVERDGL